MLALSFQYYFNHIQISCTHSQSFSRVFVFYDHASTRQQSDHNGRCDDECDDGATASERFVPAGRAGVCGASWQGQVHDEAVRVRRRRRKPQDLDQTSQHQVDEREVPRDVEEARHDDVGRHRRHDGFGALACACVSLPPPPPPPPPPVPPLRFSNVFFFCFFCALRCALSFDVRRRRCS